MIRAALHEQEVQAESRWRRERTIRGQSDFNRLTGSDAASFAKSRNVNEMNSSTSAFLIHYRGSTETTAKSRSTFVDATLPPDERGKRLRTRLVLRYIPQHARPLRSCSLVDFLTISGAQDDRGEWFNGAW